MSEIQTARLMLSCKVTEKRKHTQIHCVTLDSRHRLASTTPAQMPSVLLNTCREELQVYNTIL